MKTPVFTGSAVALVTPFRGDKIDYEKLDQLIEYHIQNGTDAVVVCATTGESCTQTAEEHLIAIDRAVQTAAGRIKIIGSTGSNDTAHALMMSRNAQSYGVDGLLMVTPYYNKTTQRGLIAHYNYLADNLDTPIILYNVPSRTGVNIEPATYLALSEHPNIAAIKEANGNLSKIVETAALVGDKLDIYSGNDDQIVPILSIGGKGVISVLSNIMPAATSEMCKRWFDGDTAGSTQMQLRLLPLINALFCEVNPIPVKAAMAAMHWCENYLRLPLTPMEEVHAQKLYRLMREQKLI